MRSLLFTVLPTFLALVSVLPGSVAFHQERSHAHAAHHGRPHHPIHSRQHREDHPNIDVCSFITSEVVIEGLKQQQIENLKEDINFDMCLCMSSIPAFITSDMRGQYLGRVMGNDVARSFLAGMCGENNPWSCSYPSHATPSCAASNPCHFECESPRSLQDGHCVCQIGWKSCNGDCIPESRSCGSSVPRPHKRGVDSLEDARKVCGSKEVCGIPGEQWPGSLPFDCVDVMNDEESCGGCLAYHDFCDASEQPALGVDCTGVPGVKKVACLSGHCDVSECSNGWELQNGSCVPHSEKRQVAGLSAIGSALSSAKGVLGKDALPMPL